MTHTSASWAGLNHLACHQLHFGVFAAGEPVHAPACSGSAGGEIPESVMANRR